jgi:phosphohistidine swiveling domain-containing protein
MTAHGFTKKLYKSNIPVYKINLSYHKQGEGDWFSLLSDHQHIGRMIVRKYMHDKGIIVNLYKQWLKNFNIMMRNYYIWFKKDFKGFSNEELIAWSNKIYKFYRDISLPGFIDGYMFYADKRFDDLLREYCLKNHIKNYPKIFSALSAPIEPSFINEEEEDLKRLLKFFIRNGYKIGVNLPNFLKHKKYLLELLNKHLLKYSWIKSSYAGYNEYKTKDVHLEIKKLLSNGIKTNNFLAKNKKSKVRLLKQYGFSEEIKSITNLTEMLVKWQDQRKVYSLTFVSLQSKILKEISTRTKIDFNLLYYAYSKELKSILNDNFNKTELEKRKKSSLFIYKNGEIVDIFTGIKAKSFLNKASKIEVRDVKEIKGMVASLGKVTGRVKIIMSSKYISKIKKGDILIAPMTRPEHLIGMKKAKAIVTDDGGITCHASIISRELGIPCIIGTKIATKVLHDGDWVEVDANKGIVRVLKRAVS